MSRVSVLCSCIGCVLSFLCGVSMPFVRVLALWLFIACCLCVVHRYVFCVLFFVCCLCALRLCFVFVPPVLRIVCAMSDYCVVCIPPLVMLTLRRPSIYYLCAVRLWLCVPECFPSHGSSVCSPSVCLAVCRQFVNKLCAARRKYFVCYPSMGFMCISRHLMCYLCAVRQCVVCESYLHVWRMVCVPYV